MPIIGTSTVLKESGAIELFESSLNGTAKVS